MQLVQHQTHIARCVSKSPARRRVTSDSPRSVSPMKQRSGATDDPV
jgi:hypothetical protein